MAAIFTNGKSETKCLGGLNNYIDRFIDMKGRVKEHRQINHFEGAGNTASFPSKSCKPVSLRKVVTFDQMCF